MRSALESGTAMAPCCLEEESAEALPRDVTATGLASAGRGASTGGERMALPRPVAPEETSGRASGNSMYSQSPSARRTAPPETRMNEVLTSARPMLTTGYLHRVRARAAPHKCSRSADLA